MVHYVMITKMEVQKMYILTLRLSRLNVHGFADCITNVIMIGK